MNAIKNAGDNHGPYMTFSLHAKSGRVAGRFLPTISGRLALLAGAMLMFVGCGQRIGPSSEALKAFDGAPAEVKQAWDKALAADKANDYVTAKNLLDGLKQVKLSDLQTQALDAESAAFEQRVMQAAEKNDPAAVNAVKEFNQSKNRRK
jgi:hypothetical protein